MKVKSATIEIRPRSVTEIVDLAGLFYRRHLAVVFGLMMVLGVPLLIAAMGLHYLTGRAWVPMLFFWLVVPIPSCAVTLAASRIVFGTHLTVRRALVLYRSVWAGLYFRILGQRLITLLLTPVVFGMVLKLKWAFTPMIVMLERLTGYPMALRRKGLHRRSGSGGFGLDTLLSLLVVPVSVLGIVVVLELVFTDFLNIWVDEGLFAETVFDDPVRLAVWGLAILLVYPLVTLSWFFLYLNARIRGEGWDLELGFKSASARVSSEEEAAA